MTMINEEMLKVADEINAMIERSQEDADFYEALTSKCGQLARLCDDTDKTLTGWKTCQSLVEFCVETLIIQW